MGKSSALVFEFGGVAELSKQFRFGAYVFNLNQARLSEDGTENLPTSLKVGASYLPIPELMINAEVIKRIDSEERLRVGLGYDIIKNVSIRTGIETNPVRGSFGLGSTGGRFLVDYAYGNHSILGDIHDFSFGITL